MKIALINNLYEPISRGGAERIVQLQAELLRQAGHKVIIITAKPWGMKLKKNDDGIFRVGGLAGGFFHLHRVPKSLRLVWHFLSWCDLITPFYVSLKLAYSGCKLAIGHNLTGISLRLPRFIIRYNIRYIQVLHDIQYLHPSGLMYKGHEKLVKSFGAKIYQRFTKKNLKAAETIISPSSWLAQLFLDLEMTSAQKLQILANPVKLSNSHIKHQHKQFSFLFVGQLEPHKGILELLKALGEVSEPIQVNIVGEGTLTHQVAEFAKKDPRIKLYGRLKHDSILKLMSQSSLLILPSICYENLPTVILEAFAQKLPVMGSDWGGIQELLADHAGILINPLDHKTFSDSLKSAISLDASALKEYADCAYKKTAKFDSETYSEALLKLI